MLWAYPRAESATKLIVANDLGVPGAKSVNAGSASSPVYFSGGIPCQCNYDFSNFYDKSEMDDLLDALEERISSLETDLAALAKDFEGHSHGYVTNYELDQAINGVQQSIDALSARIDNIKECTCTPNPTN